MPVYLIHHKGAWNEYTTVADGACWEAAMTTAEIERLRRAPGLEDRIARALATGCSGHDWTLDDCIRCNRAGPNESKMSRDEFIARYLTLERDRT